MEKVAWTNSPPPIPEARIWPPPEGLSYFLVLGPYVGVWCHWIGKRSLPCLDEDCPGPRHKRPMVWFGYLPGAIPIFSDQAKKNLLRHDPAILACGPEAIEEIKPVLGNYPGPILTIKRMPKSRKWTLEKIKREVKVVSLPRCPDTRATLYRVWGMRPPGDQAAADPRRKEDSANGEI